MNICQKDFEDILAALQQNDGVHWLRILGQTHWQFHEFPFWVLVEDQLQAIDAVPILQQSLKPLQDASENDITVSFFSYQGEKEEWYGMFEGDEFFNDSDVLSEMRATNRLRKREVSVFDDAYPNDPWAIKETPIE